MIKTELIFSTAEAVKILRNLGLKVELRDIPVSFYTHGSTAYVDMIPTWVVENPHTGQSVKVEELFNKYLQEKKRTLFLQPEKIEIFKLFEK
ncbi:hypothetical protein D0T49_02025 [Paludibacter sp. 221]|uniref:hypothetical protein n=1 Tax=Paludibacter sp. 221 TaxID=2302939 RepID=UPI0013D56073|nr:hypothetical protein [Paludibacter sp. 221]NDV45828.1 hypothetical protein [Paludibacter sp. 221]